MYALVAETGALLWKTKLGDRIESSACVSLCGKYIIVGKEKLQSQIEHLFIILHENVVKGEKRWGQGVNLTMHKINETNVILVMYVRFCDYLKFL